MKNKWFFILSSIAIAGLPLYAFAVNYNGKFYCENMAEHDWALIPIILFFFAQFMTLVPRKFMANWPRLLHEIIDIMAANYGHSRDKEKDDPD